MFNITSIGLDYIKNYLAPTNKHELFLKINFLFNYLINILIWLIINQMSNLKNFEYKNDNSSDLPLSTTNNSLLI